MPRLIDFIDSSIARLIIALSKLLCQMEAIAAAIGIAKQDTDRIAAARTARSDT